MTRGIMLSITCRAILGIAGQVIPPVTPVVTCPAADRIDWETTDEGLREVTSQTAGPTMAEITSRTKD
jgi:hypothetical protein